MKTIEERAKKYADEYVVGDVAIIVDLIHNVAEESYIAGATEQKEIDTQKVLKEFCAICMEDNDRSCECAESSRCWGWHRLKNLMED